MKITALKFAFSLWVCAIYFVDQNFEVLSSYVYLERNQWQISLLCSDILPAPLYDILNTKKLSNVNLPITFLMLITQEKCQVMNNVLLNNKKIIV